MRIILKSILSVLFFIGSFSVNAQTFQQQLSSIKGISFKQIPNNNFKEYYEIYILQPIDHTNPFSKKFNQRLFLGFNSIDLPVLINTDGYQIDYVSKPTYQNELIPLLKANLITVEHRYFGKSIPDTLDYNYLNVSQASADAHQIRNLFSELFKNKWISTGISKGGQAALAYKSLYTSDVCATIVYGTAVKKKLIENGIDSMLAEFEKTECGNKLEQIRMYVFKNKQQFIPLFQERILKNNILMKQLDFETGLDYLLLELPFSFLQNGNSCTNIPSITSGKESILDFLLSIVPPKLYDYNYMERLKPAYYMWYHELGFYEYDTKKYKLYLNQDNYSNKNFAPQNIKIGFDKTYLDNVNMFLKTKEAENIIFIYGANDPWASMQNTGKARKEIIKNGSHKSRIENMEPVQKENLLKYLNSLLKN
jgi:hypothetical protein